MKTLITTDIGHVARLVSRFPGPVFDLRLHDGEGSPQIRIGGRVLPLDRMSPSSLRDILQTAERMGHPVYVVGKVQDWEQLRRRAGGQKPASLDRIASTLASQADAESAQS